MKRLLMLANEQHLLRHYHRTRDESAREALVERFLPLAQHVARRYRGAGRDAEDVAQVASLGLLNAIDRFDPERGAAFSTFAVPTILGEIKRYFRDKGWLVRVPRDLQDRALAVVRTTDELERELGHPPTAKRIADHLDMTVEQVLEARIAAEAHHGVSLDGTGGDEDDERYALADTLGVVDGGFSQAEDAATLERLMAGLTCRQRTVLHLRFAEDLTQAEIGARVGMSQMHVSRVIRQAIEHLRASADG